MKNTIIAPLFQMTSQGIGKWKKELRPIVCLIEKYFSKEDIEEFLLTNKIQKQEAIKDLSVKDLANLKEFQKQLILNEISKKEQELEELKQKLNMQ